MKLETKTGWQCDVCDGQAEDSGIKMPRGWRECYVTVHNVRTDDFIACDKCTDYQLQGTYWVFSTKNLLRWLFSKRKSK